MSAAERKRLCVLAAAFAVSAAAASPTPAAQAGEARYPARPVRLIVPFPPSGGTDIVARLLGQRLTEGLGQQFVVDNRPGAASTIGASLAAKAAPDGYTLLLVTASYAISAGYYRNLPYESVKDFAAVSLIASGPLVTVVHPSLQVSSVKELIALSKSTPGALNYASGGSGGINHLAGELFNALAGTRLVHVAYKGAGPALAALLGGEVQVMVATVGSALPHVTSGKVRALATCGERRAAALPNLPTMAEAGVRGYAADNWYGLLAPRGTPGAIVNLLNAQISAALKAEDVRTRFTALGFEPMISTPAQFHDYLQREVEKWARVTKTAGVRLEP